FAQHGDRDQEIAFAFDQVVQAFTFSTKNQRAIHLVVQRIVSLGAAFVQADSPDIVFLQLFDAPRDICDLGNRQVLAGSGRSFGDCSRHGGRPPFGDDDAVRSRSVSGT